MPASPAIGKAGDKALRVVEDAIYALACLVLVAGAIALLVKAGWDLFEGLTGEDGVTETAKSVLDTLLLVFILVELLGAVRESLTQRRLVAEPFLLVGVIATIKEIVVTSVDAGETVGRPEFDDVMIEIGVLGGMLLALAIALFLLRLKEREPEEVEGA